ncbi:MAG: site-2 protease family protein [Polyangiaceae bacterium]|nr:site-2 protease family protein [Polyangiaceae bacterium]
MTTVVEALVWFLVFVFSTTCHEAAHAWAALKGGDPTAYEGGQVSLDPLPHLRREPFGMVVMPLLSLFVSGAMIGWASAPYDARWAQRFPRRAALMSLAGPVANFLLAGVALAIMHALLASGVFVAPPAASAAHLVAVPGAEDVRTPLSFLATLLSVTLYLNVTLGLFNLLPVPPLDGAGVLEGATHPASARFFQALREQPLMQLAGLLVAWQLFKVVRPGLGFLLGLLHPGAYG